MDFEIAINGLFEEPVAEAADAFTNAPNLETVMPKCKLGVLHAAADQPGQLERSSGGHCQPVLADVCRE